MGLVIYRIISSANITNLRWSPATVRPVIYGCVLISCASGYIVRAKINGERGSPVWCLYVKGGRPIASVFYVGHRGGKKDSYAVAKWYAKAPPL